MKSILELMKEGDYEQVVFCRDEVSGLQALIALHDTTLGPAIGGVRMKEYNDEDEALEDVLGLSRSMTLKAAAAGLNFGGGGAVIIGNSEKVKTEALLRAFGRNVEALGGRFLSAEDAGITVEDMETIGLETKHVVGIGESRGGGGNPSVKAVYGVFRGIQACLQEAFGDSGFRHRTIAIQGVGVVGSELARLAFEDGAKVKIADTNPVAIDVMRKRFDVEVISPSAILETECDILAPCAYGGVFDEETAGKVKARVVAGAANNQLVSDSIGDLLFRRGLVYAPDFVINAGGLINAADELDGYNETRAMFKISRIYQAIEAILKISRERNISTTAAAGEKALERMRQIREMGRTWLPAR